MPQNPRLLPSSEPRPESCAKAFATAPSSTKCLPPTGLLSPHVSKLQIYLDRNEALSNADWVYILRTKDDP